MAKGDVSDDDMPKFRILHKTSSAADASNPESIVSKPLKPAMSAVTVSNTPPLTLPKPIVTMKPPLVSSESSSIHTSYQMGLSTSTKVTASSSQASTPESPENVPVFRILRKTEQSQQSTESKLRNSDFAKKRRSTEPSLPMINVLSSKDDHAEEVPKYRILSKTSEHIDSSPTMSENSDSDDSDAGARLPEFKMLKESSMSFGGSTQQRSKGKSASFGKADKRAKSDLSTDLDTVVPGGRGKNLSSNKKSKEKNYEIGEELYKAPVSNEPVRVPSHILFQVYSVFHVI